MRKEVSDLPTEYNEFVELLESNDVTATADILTNNYVPIDVLEELVTEIRSWSDQYGDDKSAMSNTEKTTVASYHRCADELQEVIDDYD